MKRFTTLMFTLAMALPLAAQDAPKPVATINGEVVTAEKLDALWARLGTQMREQYAKNGGKAAFLDNYLRKRLVVQEALKAGFDKKPDVQADIDAARESALFDRYVRDVVASSIVSDTALRKYYDENKEDFATPEELHIRHIIIVPNGAGPRPKSQEDAQELIKKISAELTSQTFTLGHDVLGTRARERAFEEAAKRYSEDGVAQNGGDLGWVGKGVLDPKFEETAWMLPVGTISGIVETRFGYHLILVTEKHPAGTESFEAAKPKIREFLMTQHASDVVEAVSKLTTELRNASRISVYPENIK